MIRSALLFFVITAALAQNGAVSETPAPDRGPYQTAYRDWHTADPDLARDTSAANPAMGARADKVAAGAAKYYAARKTYLDQMQADTEQRAAALEPVPQLPPIDAKPAGYLATQTRLVNGSIDSIADNPDRAIQRLRAALDRERTALIAVSSALLDTQRGYDQAQAAAIAAEQARSKVAQNFQSLTENLKQTATLTDQAGSQWAEYYRNLSDGLRGVISTEAIPAPAAVVSDAHVGEPPPNSTATPSALSPATPAPVIANPAGANPAGANPAGANSAPALRTRSVTPLPLSRYVGAWIYPTVDGEFHGAEPASADMLLHENNGQAKGTLVVWFKVSPGSKTEPQVRLDFEGPFQSTRNQSFPVVTGNGAKGTVELIPGNVYNLIQVRFTTEDKPEAVRQADFLLIKK